MRRFAVLFGALLLAWCGLGAAGLLPAPWDLVERRNRGGGGGADAEGEAVSGAGAGGVSLVGREGGPRRGAADEGARAGDPPPVPSEVRGSAPKGAVVRGRVRLGAADGPGPPAAGARVTLGRPNPVTSYLRASPEGRWDVLEARADAQGRFAFLDVRPAKGYAVRAFGPAGGTVSAPRSDLGERQVLDLGDLVLPLRAGGLAGRVVDGEGQGVAGARIAVTWQVESILGMVLADPDTLPELEAETRSAEDGSFLLEGLEPGPKTVVVVAAGRGGKVLAGPRVEPGQRTRLADVRLSGTGVVAGRVEWDDGRPVPGARVFAGEPKPGKPTLHTVVTGPDGAFRLEHLDGEEARLGVFVPGIPVDPSEDVAMGRTDVVLRLPAAGSLGGRVVRKADGRPVERFGVRLEPAQPEGWMARAVRALIDGALGPQGFVAPEGRFRLPVVAHGTWRLVVSAPGYPEARSEAIEVRAGAEADAGVIALAEGHALAGSILRAGDGAPMPDVRLWTLSVRSSAGEEGEGWDPSEIEADGRTDADGRFELPPLTPGVYVLRLQHRFLQGDRVERVDLTRGSVSDFVWRVPPAGALKVRLVDGAGRPVAGERAIVACAAGGGRLADASDEQGELSWSGLPPGPCLVRWWSARESARLLACFEGAEELRRQAYEALRADGGEQQVVAGEEREVVARVGARVNVTFRAAAAREPAVGEVGLEYAQAYLWRWFRLDAAGEAQAQVEPGTYVVRLFLRQGDGWEVQGEEQQVTIPDVPSHLVEVGR